MTWVSLSGLADFSAGTTSPSPPGTSTISRCWRTSHPHPAQDREARGFRRGAPSLALADVRREQDELPAGFDLYDRWSSRVHEDRSHHEHRPEDGAGSPDVVPLLRLR